MKPTEFNPAVEIGKLAREILRISDGQETRTGADVVSYCEVLRRFFQAAAVIGDIGNNEIEEALTFYEKKKASEDERDMSRPKKVVAPGRHAATTVRFMSRGYPKVARRYRGMYVPLANRKSTSGGTKRKNFDL